METFNTVLFQETKVEVLLPLQITIQIMEGFRTVFWKQNKCQTSIANDGQYHDVTQSIALISLVWKENVTFYDLVNV